MSVFVDACMVSARYEHGMCKHVVAASMCIMAKSQLNTWSSFCMAAKVQDSFLKLSNCSYRMHIISQKACMRLSMTCKAKYIDDVLNSYIGLALLVSNIVCAPSIT